MVLTYAGIGQRQQPEGITRTTTAAAIHDGPYETDLQLQACLYVEGPKSGLWPKTNDTTSASVHTKGGGRGYL